MALIIINLVLTFILAVAVVEEGIKIKKLRERLGSLAMKTADLRQLIEQVDESNGTFISQLSKEFHAFKDDYGDATVEAIREQARKEKAFADGIDNIMSYGARFQGRGDKV